MFTSGSLWICTLINCCIVFCYYEFLLDNLFGTWFEQYGFPLTIGSLHEYIASHILIVCVFVLVLNSLYISYWFYMIIHYKMIRIQAFSFSLLYNEIGLCFILLLTGLLLSTIDQVGDIIFGWFSDWLLETIPEWISFTPSLLLGACYACAKCLLFYCLIGLVVCIQYWLVQSWLKVRNITIRVMLFVWSYVLYYLKTSSYYTVITVWTCIRYVLLILLP